MQSPEPSSPPVLLNIGLTLCPSLIRCPPCRSGANRRLIRLPCCRGQEVRYDRGDADAAGARLHARGHVQRPAHAPAPPHHGTVRSSLVAAGSFAASEDQSSDLCHCVQGTVFVDRDGKHFRHVLNWLRDGAIPVMSESEYQQLLREAEYYQLLVKKNGSIPSRLL